MKKIQIKEMEMIQGGSPRMCWGLAGAFLVGGPLTWSGSVIVGAACLVSSI